MPATGAGPRRLCPLCLLGLALDAGEEIESDDDPSLPGPVYRVLTVLSSEHDRTTYLAEQGETRRLVTLDVVTIPPAGSGDSLAGCRDRLRALMRWRHRGVPRVSDGRLSPSGDFYVVSDYVNGQRLDRYCEVRQMDSATRARLLSEVCDIIADAHRNGVCHGRLRPDLVVAVGSREEVRAIVLGFSVTPGWTPTVADDVAGLKTVARALGWRGLDGPPPTTVDAVCEAVRQGWS
jgi:serine/threonine protein kinase